MVTPRPRDAVARIALRLLDSDLPLERRPLAEAARAIAAVEDPLHSSRSAAAAVDELLGMGPLEALLGDPSITDILVNGPDEVWVERDGELQLTGVTFRNAAAVAAAVERVIAPLGLRLDFASPAVDSRLPDGSRLHAILPPIARGGPVVAIRRFTRAVPALDELVGAGSASLEAVEVMRSAVHSRLNIVVCGGTGSGKTTLLNLLSDEISPGDRVVVIEDSAELELKGHVVRLEARPPNPEGTGAVELAALVRHALRLRPDRIVVGEVRGSEALDMVQAMATGHRGSMSTVHAADAAEALWRLELLASQRDFGLAPDAVRALLRSAVDLIVVMERSAGVRRVVAVLSVDGDSTEVLA